MSNPFFSLRLRCPNCHLIGFYIDTVFETVVCDYCSHTFIKKTNIDNGVEGKGMSSKKNQRKRLLDSLHANINQ